MSDTTKDGNDVELEEPLELDLQPEAETSPAGTASAPEVVAEALPGDGLAQGQWVWQYAAPPPPPSFLAVFFSGQAVKSHYRFFACALLVVIGCLLPWGPEGAEGLASTTPPSLAGYETVTGAISLALGLWLLFTACYGVYTGRHKILPVFLMIEPAVVAWMRTTDAWGRLPAEQGALEKLPRLFEVAGTGVMLTLVGATWVAGGFLLLLGKVYAKKDDKGTARRATRTGKDKDGRPDGEAALGVATGTGDATAATAGEPGSPESGGNGKDPGGRAGRRGRRG